MVDILGFSDRTDGIQGLDVSTICHETALIDTDMQGARHIYTVEIYLTDLEAALGHERWCAFAADRRNETVQYLSADGRAQRALLIRGGAV